MKQQRTITAIHFKGLRGLGSSTFSWSTKFFRMALLMLFIAMDCLLLTSGSQLYAQEPTHPPQTLIRQHMVIIDGSRSMWGRVKNIPKINHVQSAMAGFVQSLNPKVHLGLSAYGHRTRGRCDDIEIMLPPKPLNAEGLIERVKAITPLGRTPLSLALEQTAKAMAYAKRSGDITLITDGLENCNRNPCDQVRGLMKQAKDLKIHLITFGLSDKETQPLACISSLGQGTFFKAKTRGDLDTALDNRARAINKTIVPSDVSSSQKRPPSPPAKPLPKLKLQLSFADKSAPLAKPVHWLIYKLGANGNAAENTSTGKANPAQLSLVSEEIAQTYQAQLPQGDYEVEGRYLHFKIRKKINLKKGDNIQLTLPLNIGYVTMGALSLPANELTGTGYATLTPLSKEKTLGTPIQLSYSPKSNPLLVRSGLYLVQVRRNNHISKYQKLVAAGAITKINAFAQMARLNLALTHSTFDTQDDTTPPKDAQNDEPMRLQIHRIDGSALYPIVTTIAPLPFYDLEAGRYQITATKGYGTTNIVVTLSKGQTLNQELSLSLARLMIPQQSLHSISQLRLHKDKTETSAPQTILISKFVSPLYIAPGSYTLSYQRRGATNASNQKFHLEPQQSFSLLQPKTGGELKLSVTKNETFLEPLVYWHIFRSNGMPVAHGIETSASISLPQGTYELKGRLNHKPFTRTFKITANEQTKVTLSENLIALKKQSQTKTP